MDHKGCTIEDYPDLSLNLIERNQIKEERARAMRETRDP
jgi:hypothetical protein